MPRKIILDEEEEEEEIEAEENQSDVQASEGSEGEAEAEDDVTVDQELDEVDDAIGMEEDEKDDELEEEDDSELDALSSPPADIAEHETIPHPKLKIKLKLPASNALSTATATTTTASTPEGASRAASRRGASRDIDVESEDSDDSTPSASASAPGRALTARQAVLRNVVDSSHVSLVEPPNPRKKKPLTEIEIALKREETARKRKNMSEKKLEDEKAETINRLLKKQSRTKGRRNALATAEDHDTPVPSASREADDDEAREGSTAPVSVVPTMYRWVSTVKADGAVGEGTRRMMLSFSVPISVLPPLTTTAIVSQESYCSPMQVEQPTCDVLGCSVLRKYRLTKNWQRGACGMAHLKLLESQLDEKR